MRFGLVVEWGEISAWNPCLLRRDWKYRSGIVS